jgi:hypothetical protein
MQYEGILRPRAAVTAGLSLAAVDELSACPEAGVLSAPQFCQDFIRTRRREQSLLCQARALQIAAHEHGS